MAFSTFSRISMRVSGRRFYAKPAVGEAGG